jgi:hypothetical protein
MRFVVTAIAVMAVSLSRRAAVGVGLGWAQRAVIAMTCKAEARHAKVGSGALDRRTHSACWIVLLG